MSHISISASFDNLVSRPFRILMQTVVGVNLCDLDTLVPTEQSWRLMTLIAAAPMIPVYISRLFFSDESLRYLAKAGNYRQTLTVIRKMARMNGVSDDQLRDNEYFIQLQALWLVGQCFPNCSSGAAFLESPKITLKIYAEIANLGSLQRYFQNCHSPL